MKIKGFLRGSKVHNICIHSSLFRTYLINTLFLQFCWGKCPSSLMNQGRPSHNHNHSFFLAKHSAPDVTSKRNMTTHQMKIHCVFSVVHSVEGASDAAFRGTPVLKIGRREMNSKWLGSRSGRPLSNLKGLLYCLLWWLPQKMTYRTNIWGIFPGWLRQFCIIGYAIGKGSHQ